MSDIAVIVLAAGNSSRMGFPKQLLPFRGKPLLRHAAEAAIGSGSRPVIVVLGARAEETQPVLEDLPVVIAVNPDWSRGMGTSIHAGLRALESCSAEGAIFTLADQPFITSDILDTLTRKHRETGKAIVAARYAGTVGVPVLFSRKAFPWLQALQQHEGCKGVILNHPEEQVLLDCPEGAIDIDTPSEYQSLAESSTGLQPQDSSSPRKLLMRA